MTLQVLSTTPLQNDNDVAIDSNLTVTFNQAIDPFTIEKGVTLYILDSNLDYSFIPYTYSIVGNRLTIVPTSLVADKKHFLTILPGNDPARFISSQTVSDPIYTRSGVSTGTANINSYYSGTTNITYSLIIGLNNTVDIIKGTSFLATMDYSNEASIGDNELTISLIGTFDIGDEISISCFKASGTENIYKVDFDTTKYITLSSSSVEITDADLETIIEELFIVDTIPEDLSVDNIKCNPVVIKFNRTLSTTDDIASKIIIKKFNIATGRTKRVKFAPVINGNILKLYLTGIDNE